MTLGGRFFNMTVYTSDMERLASRAIKKSKGFGGPSADGEYAAVGAPIVYNKRLKGVSGTVGSFVTGVKMVFKAPEASRWGITRFAAAIERGIAGGTDMKSLVNCSIIQTSPAGAFALFTWDDEADAKAGMSAMNRI